MRELMHAIERTMLLSNGPRITVGDLRLEAATTVDFLIIHNSQLWLPVDSANLVRTLQRFAGAAAFIRRNHFARPG